MFVETGKLNSRIKNLQCLLYRNVADDVLFQEHFTDLDYIDWFPDIYLFTIKKNISLETLPSQNLSLTYFFILSY